MVKSGRDGFKHGGLKDVEADVKNAGLDVKNAGAEVKNAGVRSYVYQGQC